MGYLDLLIICGLQYFPQHIREDTGSSARQRTPHGPSPIARQTYHRNKTGHHQAAAHTGGQSRVLGAPAGSTLPHLLSSPLPTWNRCTGTHESIPTPGVWDLLPKVTLGRCSVSGDSCNKPQVKSCCLCYCLSFPILSNKEDCNAT